MQRETYSFEPQQIPVGCYHWLFSIPDKVNKASNNHDHRGQDSEDGVAEYHGKIKRLAKLGSKRSVVVDGRLGSPRKSFADEIHGEQVSRRGLHFACSSTRGNGECRRNGKMENGHPRCCTKIKGKKGGGKQMGGLVAFWALCWLTG